jgi:hypothetical protein
MPSTLAGLNELNCASCLQYGAWMLTPRAMSRTNRLLRYDPINRRDPPGRPKH